MGQKGKKAFEHLKSNTNENQTWICRRELCSLGAYIRKTRRLITRFLKMDGMPHYRCYSPQVLFPQILGVWRSITSALRAQSG